MSLFIYFSLLGEVLILVIALIMFFLPGTIARWGSIFLFISEYPFLVSKQIVIIIGDDKSVTYVQFGIPALFLTPFLWMFTMLTFISVQNLFDAVDRDFFGQAPKNSGRRYSKK